MRQVKVRTFLMICQSGIRIGSKSGAFKTSEDPFLTCFVKTQY